MNILANTQRKSFLVFISSLVFPLLAILLPAVLTTFKCAEFIDADIILSQIMSLHNTTLFYWGQNRFLNVIPFILQPVTSPLLNIFLVMFFSALAFFGLLWLISYSAQRLVTDRTNKILIFIVYVFNILICIFLFKPYCWREIAVRHPEYSLALIFGILTIYNFYFSSNRHAALAMVAGFLGVGINPSIILLFGIFVFFKCLYFHKVSREDVFFSVSLTAFF